MQRLHRLRICAISLALFSLSAIGFAQGSRGSITGKILDPQNAVIPGATVVVTDVLNGVATKVISNQTGY